MKSGKLGILALGLFFTTGIVMAGQSSATTKSVSTKMATESSTATKTHSESGTVSSLTSNELVLDHTWKGKKEKTNFTLDSSTKKEGNIAQGDRVTVYYRLESGKRVATELKASATKPVKL